MPAQPISIAEIANDLQDGEQLLRVEGTLVKLYPQKNTAHGTLQNGELSDGETSIKITFADCTQNMSARNQFVILECTPSQNHGMVGVKVKDDQTYGRAIWVTPNAAIQYPQGGGGQATQTQAPRNSGRTPQTAPRQPNQAPRGGGGAGARNTPPAGGGRGATPAPSGTRRAENQYEAVARFTDCFLYVFNLVNEKMTPVLPTPDGKTYTEADKIAAVQRATATIFVDVAKSGVAATWNPNYKERRFPLPPKNPKDWRECYIEKEGSKLDGKTLEQVSDEDLKKLFEFYDGRKANHPLAECIYQAAEDRGLLQQSQPSQPSNPDDEMYPDDIPF